MMHDSHHDASGGEHARPTGSSSSRRDAAPAGHDPAAEAEGPRGTSRRQFLAGAAAGAAAVAAAGSLLGGGSRTARAGTGYRPEMVLPKAKERIPVKDGEPVRMGVIGTGGMGSGHCSSIIRLANQGHVNTKIVALCDVCKPRLEACYGMVTRDQGSDTRVDMYRDYHELLNRDDIHGVLIASPEHWHGQMAIDAMAAGKDVYLEKPMTLHLDDALRVREMVLANPQLIFQVGTQMMILPKWVEARRLIAEGAIGKPVFSQTSYCRNSRDGEWNYYHIDPAVVPGENLDWDAWCGPAGRQEFSGALYARWRRYKDFSTGIVGDLLVHVMTPMMMALDAGWPTRVVATGGHYIDKDMENHDQVNINAEFEKEHTMIVAGSTCNEIGLTPMIRGHEATMYLGGRNVEIKPERPYADLIEPRTVDCPDIGNDQDQLRVNWLECMRTREPAISGVDLATKMMVVVGLATQSMWTGRAYRFDPKTMTAHAV